MSNIKSSMTHSFQTPFFPDQMTLEKARFFAQRFRVKTCSLVPAFWFLEMELELLTNQI